MVSREQLRMEGLRAYELGRLRVAARVAVVLIPLAAVCLMESRGRTVCGCVAAALVGACILLRWRDRRGFEVVATGLRAGSVPLVSGLALDRLGIECGLAGAAAYCTLLAALMGGAAGAYIGTRQCQWRERFWSVVTAAAIAAMASALGCVRLGVVGALGVIGGIGLGAVLAGGASENARPASR